MNKKSIIYVMFKSEHWNSFAKQLSKELSPNIIFYCDIFTNKNNEIDSSIEQIIGFRNIRKKINLLDNREYEIIIFDISQIAIFMIYNFIKKADINAKFNFIQHGLFENSKPASLNKREVSWFLQSIYVMLNFFLQKPSFNSLVVVYNNFKFGSWKNLDTINQSIEIDKAFIWTEQSKEFLLKHKSLNLKKTIITGSPDKNDLFTFHENGKIYYISQPLWKTGHVDNSFIKKILKELERISCQYEKEVIILLHPKLEDFSNGKFKTLRQSEILLPLSTSMVIGHFSSLLLVIDKNIPKKLLGFKIEKLEEAIEIIKNDLYQNNCFSSKNYFEYFNLIKR